jgi:biotin carboxyl carrier protein
MPGLVKSVAVEVGEEVQKGQRLIVLEAMKMENDITAPKAGRIVELHTSAGATVEGGKPLVTLE